MCGLHTAGPVIRSVLQVKCIWRQSEKYEINKRKLSDVAGYGGLAVSPEPQGKSNTLHCLCPFFFFFFNNSYPLSCEDWTQPWLKYLHDCEDLLISPLFASTGHTVPFPSPLWKVGLQKLQKMQNKKIWCSINPCQYVWLYLPIFWLEWLKSVEVDALFFFLQNWVNQTIQSVIHRYGEFCEWSTAQYILLAHEISVSCQRHFPLPSSTHNV